MSINLPSSVLDELQLLASLLSVPIYIVGGAVRDSLLGYTSLDIDIVSNLTVSALRTKLQGSQFGVQPKNIQFGTALVRGTYTTYEYTTLRQDIYDSSGKHCPIAVNFVDDLLLDAERRDFTANAIYYDVMDNLLIDPLGGIADLQKKVLTTTKDPITVFSGDALRLFRGVRLSCALDLALDTEVLAALSAKAYSISSLSRDRIRHEFNKILVLDTFYNVPNAHYNAVKLLIDQNMMEFVVPELLMGQGVIQRKDFHKYDVLEHNLQTFRHSQPIIRLSALFHDIGKPFSLASIGSMSQHAAMGSSLTRTALLRLGYDEHTIAETERLVKYHMIGVKTALSPDFWADFSKENADIYDKFVALQRADQLARF